MHHFIFSQKDTYITNQLGLDDKNFGIDEILQIGTTDISVETQSPTKDYTYINSIFNSQGVNSFTGIFTGSIGSGSTVYVTGSISGSGLTFTASYFSGSVDGSNIVGGGIFGILPSGSNIIGIISGSLTSIDVIGIFTGQLTGSNVCLTGTGSGVDTRNQQNWTTTSTTCISRALLQFDLTAISASISNSTINPRNFSLIIKVCNEYQLPITYTIYALPISQSWNMGNGYLSDGGSDTGASWDFLDNNGGTSWYTASLTTPRQAIDFIHNPSLVTSSFGFGGGTFYTSSWCSQSFDYQSSDINMDITSMVMAWLSGSIPNQGLILISSDELESTGSGFMLKFFSRDTNTIYSPYLDVKWDDINGINGSGFVTGNYFTSSITFATASAAISASVVSGSNLSGAGGVRGIFSASAFITTTPNYITASGQGFNSSIDQDPFTHDSWYSHKTMCDWGKEFSDRDDLYYYNNAQLIEAQFALNYYDDYENFGYDTIGWGWSSGNYWNPGSETWSSGCGNRSGWSYPCDIANKPTCPPVHGNYPVFQFTGSFTGSFYSSASVNGILSGSTGYNFTVDYFSGSVDGASIQWNYSEITGTLINGFVSGSLTSAGTIGVYAGPLTSSVINLYGSGSGNYLDSTYLAFTGFIDGDGLSGNITGVPVLGIAKGLLSISQSYVFAPCGNSFTASYVTASFLSGPFVGDMFTAYYMNYTFLSASLTGSWPQNALLGEQINISLPSPIYPYTYANIYGTYINGDAIGLYSTSGSNSASFSGQFIDGNVLGGYITVQLSGSVVTSSYYYTSSVNITSSALNALDTTRPFTITLQNVHSEYKSGDIIKFGVFGRIQYPLKYFRKTTQQEQYIIPEYLPTSSYYALKDNETGEIVLNFDAFTAIGCEYPNGNYFFIDTTGLPLERYYKVLIRIEDSNSTYTIDTEKTFKIVR